MHMVRHHDDAIDPAALLVIVDARAQNDVSCARRQRLSVTRTERHIERPARFAEMRQTSSIRIRINPNRHTPIVPRPQFSPRPVERRPPRPLGGDAADVVHTHSYQPHPAHSHCPSAAILPTPCGAAAALGRRLLARTRRPRAGAAPQVPAARATGSLPSRATSPARTGLLKMLLALLVEVLVRAKYLSLGCNSLRPVERRPPSAADYSR